MRFWYVLIVVVAVCSQLAFGQQVMKSVVGAGGTISKSGGIVVNGTVGQPVIGKSSDNRTTALSGFWYSVVRDPRTSSATGGSTSTQSGSSSAGVVAVTPHPVTNISSMKFSPECTGQVTIDLVDLSGEKIATIFNEYVSGEISLSFDSNGLVTGTYMLRVKTSCSEQSQRLMILH
ncbi:MAG: hypothetical protein ACK54V_01795 [Candidatus Kapaibacterium sp.]|jgi:hypothetical protein